MKYKNHKSLYIELSIFIVLLLSRLIVSNFGDWFHSLDGVNFLMAIEDYNIAEERPHLPGYIIYIYFFKIITLFFSNTNSTLILFHALFQALSGVFLFKIIRKKFEQSYSLLLLAFIYSIPMVYFYGTMSEIYSLDLLLISVFLYLLVNNKLYILLPFIAFIMGARQSSGVLLFPVFLASLYFDFKDKSINWKYLSASILSSIIIVLLWLVPLVESANGLSNYLKMMNFNKFLLLSYSYKFRIVNFLSYSLFYFIPFLLLLLFSTKEKIKNRREIVYLLSIILPQLFIYMFYHYNKGYALFMIPAILLLVINIFKINKKVLKILIIINLSFFFFYPAITPSYKINMTGTTRGISLIDVWIQKINYTWLPTVSTNNRTIELHEDIIINKSKIIGLLEDNALLVDKSNMLFPKSFVYLLPEVEILDRSFKLNHSYFSYKGLINYSEKGDLFEKIKHSYILVNKEYYKEYLTDISHIKLELEYYYIIKVNEEFIDDYLKINKLHFVG